MKANPFVRLLAFLLVVALLLQIFPADALALSSMDHAETAPQVMEEPEETIASENVHVLGELLEERTEFSKTYRLSNGLNMATVYPDAIHYEEDGIWKDIDNTLKLASEAGGDVYTNTAGSWEVALPKELSRNKGVEVTKGENTVRFYLAGPIHGGNDLAAQSAARTIESSEETYRLGALQTASAAVEEIDLSVELEEAEHPETVLENLTSRLRYENIHNNTDVVYDLQGNRLKESIIMQEYDAQLRGYRYVLETEGMLPVLNEDGRIGLYEKDAAEPVMIMPAPYLLDDAGAYCADVEVSLTEQNGAYNLTYLLPMKWLAEEDRVWPVVLDPAIEDESSNSNAQDHTVYANFITSGSTGHNANTLTCGYDSSVDIMRFYMKYTALPKLSSSDVLVNAVLKLCLTEEAGPAAVVTAHEVLGTWSESSLTWDNMPKYNSTVEDYALCDNTGYYYWDITSLANKWYTGENNGMMFRLTQEMESGNNSNCWKRFFSSEFTPDNGRPMLILTYRNNSGLESYWDYTTASAGRAGTGYVNQYTGNLVWVREDLGFGGNRMPVSISHIYNSCDKGKNLFGLGYGWRTNYNQRVYQWSRDSKYYVWEDGDGTKHYFKYSSSGTYLDEDGLELTLKTTGSGDTKYSIKDKNGNASYFDESGRLTKISNNQETKSSIKITYKGSSDRIANIEDGAGRMYYYTYTEDDLLDRLIYKGTGDTTVSSVDFEYTNKNLTKITDEDGKSCTYGYQAGHLLSSAKDITGIKVSYSFTETDSDITPLRVSGIQESDESGSTSVAGGSLTIEYDHNQTKLTDNVNNTTNIIQFNDLGNTVSVQDDRGRAQFMQFAINGLSTADAPDNAKSNQLRLGSRLQNTVGNVLRNSSFEGTGNWSGTDAVSVSYVTTESKYGAKALKMTRETAGSASGVRSPIFSVPAGETYTFSGYVLTKNASAYLALKEESSGTFFKSEVQETHTDWTRLEVSYTNKTDAAQDVSARFMTKDAGVAYLDCVQVEAAVAASRYNLVENGDFRYTTDWSSDNGLMTRKSAAPELSEDAYRLVGEPTKKKYIYQTVAVSGKKGDSYVLAGWAKADSVPIRYDRKFALIATFNNTDGTTTSRAVEFNPSADTSQNWQYAAEAVVAKKDYDSILVKIAYYYNDNNAYFDGIQLFKEEFGSSYTYDENGNVISVKDARGKKTSYEYTGNDLTKEVLPNGAELEYTYDDWHNVKTATTGEGLKYHFTYDTYGNNTAVYVEYNGRKLVSRAAYSEDGNRLISTTDTAGRKTYYDYDADTNVLNSVKNPEDTEATRTEYTYDTMNRIDTVNANVNTGGQLSADYGYNGDLLTSVQTPTTAYNFVHGNFGLTSQVRTGTGALATYSYTAKNNFLDTLEYANGDSVEYTYSKYGQVKEQVYEDGAKVVYRYDNSGALAQVEDYATGILTKYMYDLSDRLMMYEEEAGAQNHRVRYYYDSMNNLTKVREGFNGSNRTTTYTYDKDNRVKSVSQSNTSETYGYDDYGRLEEVELKHGDDVTITDVYTYLDPTHTSVLTTSMQVGTLTTTVNDTSVVRTYEYDKNGNIIEVSDGTYTTTYVYDSANQLLRENNQKAGKTWGWTYDDGGNIRTKTEYAYTTGTPGTALDTTEYSYSTSSWGDLLISHDGNTIVSDDSGNMLSYGDEKTFTWKHGRELSGMTDDSGSWTFEYNADGLRVYRSNGTDTYKYYYNGDKLTRMVVNGQNITFGYDASGTPQYVIYGGHRYFYLTNLQGDITTIVTTTGETVVEYSYDAWGNILTTTGTMAATLGKDNPLRYRGYVYDEETGLYYLQSRYYDPQIGRFINADNLEYLGADGTPLGYNLFTYCGNNPVMGYDPTGHWDWSWEEQLAFGAGVLIIGLAILLAPPTGGTSLGAVAIGVSTIAGGTVACSGVAIVADVAVKATVNYAKKEKSNSNSNRGKNYSGNSLYNKDGERIDYEYYGNGNGNVHYDGTRGKEVLWRIENGVETMYVASKAVRKIISTPQIQRAINRSIEVVLSLAGVK